MDLTLENISNAVLVILLLIVMIVGITALLRQQGLRKQRQPNPNTQPATPPTTGAAPTASAVGWTPKFIKNHPRWTGIIILFCLLFLDKIFWLGTWTGTNVVSSVSSAFTGTPRSEWGIGIESEPTAPVAPQGKNVGGPLLWSQNAKVRVRGRFTTEAVCNNVAFASFVPPASSVNLSMTHHESSDGPNWNAFLVDFENGPMSRESLNAHAIKKPGILSEVFLLDGLSSSRMKHEVRFNNETGKQTTEGFVLNQLYVQTTGGPEKIVMDHRDAPGTFQYEVKVGANEISFTIPNQNWKWLWIAPVHHPCYQSRFLGCPVPSKGMDFDEAKDLEKKHQPTLRRNPELIGDGYSSLIPFQAILLELGGETTVLSQAVLLQAADATNGRISLRLNVPKAESVSNLWQPAKIIVGIQL